MEWLLGFLKVICFYFAVCGLTQLSSNKSIQLSLQIMAFPVGIKTLLRIGRREWDQYRPLWKIACAASAAAATAAADARAAAADARRKGAAVDARTPLHPRDTVLLERMKERTAPTEGRELFAKTGAENRRALEQALLQQKTANETAKQKVGTAESQKIAIEWRRTGIDAKALRPKDFVKIGEDYFLISLGRLTEKHDVRTFRSHATCAQRRAPALLTAHMLESPLKKWPTTRCPPTQYLRIIKTLLQLGNEMRKGSSVIVRRRQHARLHPMFTTYD